MEQRKIAIMKDAPILHKTEESAGGMVQIAKPAAMKDAPILHKTEESA